MDTNSIAETAKNISKISPQVYEDIVHPSAKNIGSSLETVSGLLNTFLTPFEILNKTISIKKEKFLKDYEKNLNKIPEEKICDPNFSTVSPMLDHLKFKITEDELRTKYAKLISSASNADCLTKPLLAFDNVLNQLTPYEIQLLELLFSKHSGQVYPIASIKQHRERGFIYVHKNLPGISFNNLSLETLSVMISNFDRLGLITIDSINFIEPHEERYKYLTESELYKSLQNLCTATRDKTRQSYPTCSIDKGSFRLTPFGMSFVDTILT